MLSSPRRRRRIAWTLALGGVFGAVVVSMLVFTGPKADTERRAGSAGPGWVPPVEQTEVTPSRRRVEGGLAVARQFLATAVARRDVGRSWSLVTPDLRAGYTKAEWARGEIPIIPYPVESARWELDYAYTNEIGFKVALFPRRGESVRPTVFNLDLRDVGGGDATRWLVEGFTPGVVRALPAGSSGPDRLLPDLGASTRSTGQARLGAGWLAVPFAVLGLALLVPLAFGVATWRRNRIAAREWARDHQPQA